METENAIAVSLSVIAIIACLVIGTMMYFDQPESVDISGIYDNSFSITSLQNDFSDLQDDFEDIDLTCEVDEDDLDDLEDDLKKYCRNRIDDECDCEDGDDGFLSTEEYGCLIEAENYTEFRTCLDSGYAPTP